MDKGLGPYIVLIESFLKGSVSVSQFELRFLRQYKEDQTNWPEQQFTTLERVFYAVDAFCGDDDLRDEDSLDEMQLRTECELAMTSLRAIQAT